MVDDYSQGDPGEYTDPGMVPSTVGPGGGLHRRFTSGSGETLQAVGGKRRKPKRANLHGRMAHVQPARHTGGHSAHKAVAHPVHHLGTLHRAVGSAPVPRAVQQHQAQHAAISGSTSTGLVFGFGAGHRVPYGHHPQAHGLPREFNTRHNGVPRRATVVSYNAGTNTAIVRFGDTPDSPTISIAVSPAITPAVMGPAKMAGVSLWSDWDPTDSLVTAVL